ncbi:unnamed protein product [Cuscuta europaea]|uniref:Uncharacterized protein n=1 Tax=Cuscuta europaea TaxID=41803 RepID=A0A9P1EG03_CUSEU|nr:unnamed protein product [Cuscuta europaea]
MCPNLPLLSFPIRLSSRKVFTQLVVYETFLHYCFHFKEYGHHPFICKKLAEKEKGVFEDKGHSVEGTQDIRKEVGTLVTTQEEKSEKEAQTFVTESGDIEELVMEVIENGSEQMVDPNPVKAIAEAKEKSRGGHKTQTELVPNRPVVVPNRISGI